MKKIYVLMLKAFFRPFLSAFFVVLFVLLMLFLFKYIDDLIGKGFELAVILQLLLYASATNVTMALPLAILLSSIMTFGSLGENYELVAIKSVGISLQHMMMPLFIVVVMLSISAFLFSDYMLPVVNLKYNSLLYDVRNQKAAFLIDEGIFNNSLSGYSIRAKKKDADGQKLHDIMIYDHLGTNDNVNILIAKEGRMFRTPDDRYLVLKLKNGIRYQESPGDASPYNPRQRLTRFRFKETDQKFDLSEFEFQRTDENLFKSNDVMLNIKQLKYYRDSVQILADNNHQSVHKFLASYYTQHVNNKDLEQSKLRDTKKNMLNLSSEKNYYQTIQDAQQQIYSIKNELEIKKILNKDYLNRVKGFIIELHKKYTLSLSCLVLFFIGAPLGAIIRNGGLGLPVVVGIVCFLTYHIISTIGEKSVRDGSFSPLLGIWMAVFVLAPVGFFITYKATKDSVLLDLDSYKQVFKKYFAKKER